MEFYHIKKNILLKISYISGVCSTFSISLAYKTRKNVVIKTNHAKSHK